MKIIDCEQGSETWLMARIGVATASNFHRILTSKTLKPSAQARGYLAQTVAEWALQRPLEDESSLYMNRGSQSETSALAKYELLRDVEVERVGFIVNDEGTIGCSPDGLIGNEGDLELKAPNAKTHVDYLLNGPPDDYNLQMMGRLWITGRRWTDFMSWHPTLPPVLVRYARDETFIAALAREVTAFVARVAEAKALILATGYVLPEPYEVVAARLRAEKISTEFAGVP